MGQNSDERRRTRRFYAHLALVGLMIVWGSTYAVTKVAVREIPPLGLALLRFVIAACVLVPVAFAHGGFARLPRPLPVVSLVLMGLTGVAGFHIGFNYALAYGSVVQSALILALLPAAIAGVSVLALGETLSKRRGLGVVLSVAGVAIIVLTAEADRAAPNPLLGAASMLGAVVAWAVYTVLAKKLASADQVVVIACASVLGMLMIAPFAAVELSRVPWPRPSFGGWAGASFLGVVASALAFIVYGRVLRELDASLVGTYMNLDPIVGVLLAVLLLGEALHTPHVIGGAVAVAGMWLASLRRGRGS
jgi:drug/metabolite transporter (DMT)-like permease